MGFENIHKVVIVDSHPIIRKGICTLLDEKPNIKLIGMVANGKELRDLLKKSNPTAIILDLKLNNTNIYRLIKDLVIIYPKVKLIAFTSFTMPKLVQDVMEFGASAFLSKTASLESIIEAIERTAKGENFICKSVYTKDKQSKVDADHSTLTPEENFEKFASLTEREMDVVILISRGLTNKEIAQKLILSKYTIETHRKNIMKKLQLKTTGQLIYFASQQGLV